mgnify:CR=1 FL=1
MRRLLLIITAVAASTTISDCDVKHASAATLVSALRRGDFGCAATLASAVDATDLAVNEALLELRSAEQRLKDVRDASRPERRGAAATLLRTAAQCLCEARELAHEANLLDEHRGRRAACATTSTAPVATDREPPRHQLCDLAEVQPRLRLRARLVRELAARSRPLRRRRLAGTNQPSTGAVKCNPASACRAAPRGGRRHVAARLPACSGSIVARRHRRVVASTMGAHRCTSTPIEVVGAPGGAVVLQQRRRGSPAGACGLPLARWRGPAGPRPARAGAHAERSEA